MVPRYNEEFKSEIRKALLKTSQNARNAKVSQMTVSGVAGENTFYLRGKLGDCSTNGLSWRSLNLLIYLNLSTPDRLRPTSAGELV
jgi:hypothetical protein